jgi:hypothetical protein
MGKLYMTTIRTVKIERLSRLEGVSGECRRRLFGVPGPIRGARGTRERIRRIGRRIGLRGLQYRDLSLFVRLCSVLRWCAQVVWRMRRVAALHVFSKYWSWSPPGARRAASDLPSRKGARRPLHPTFSGSGSGAGFESD